MPPTPEQILAFLQAKGIQPLRVVDHPETRTSEASAEARGEPLSIGGKAILMKAGEQFRLFVLPADRKIATALVRKHLAIKNLRFATPEELLALTGLAPGSVPPFGRPILPFDLHIDRAIAHNDRIAFNAASLTRSIVLATQDYLSAAGGDMFSFAQPPVHGQEFP